MHLEPVLWLWYCEKISGNVFCKPSYFCKILLWKSDLRTFMLSWRTNGRHWNCLFKKDGGKTKSSVLQMLFYGRRIITMHIRLMSFLSDAKIGSYFLFLLVDVFCLGVVDIFQTNYFLGFIHLYIFGKLMKCWTNVKISIFKSKYIFI